MTSLRLNWRAISSLDAGQLRAAILAYAQHRSATLVKKRVTATRMFLRFLIATGRCQPSLEAAIPAIAQ
jgi:integrase/recombinase XerD